MGSPLSPRASQGTQLHDRLKLEKCELSYADLHSEVIKNGTSTLPTSSGLQQKQRVEKKAIENEELVKYMSNLPSYLEKGENLQEKVLNVGVLDWRRLEKWQYNNKQIPNRNCPNSSSSSNTSSYFSTDGSSTHSSRGHSCSPARQRMHRTSLQSHLNASSIEVCSQGVKSSVKNVGKFQDNLKAAPGNSFNGQQNILRTFQPVKKNPSEIKMKECNRKVLDPQSISETKTSQNLENCVTASLLKGKMKIQDVGSTKGLEKFQDCNVIDHVCAERHKTVVLLFPGDGPESSHSAISDSSNLTEINDQRSREASRRSFSQGYHHKEVYFSGNPCDIPHSCPQPCKADGIKHSETEQCRSVDDSVKCSSDLSQLPSSAKKAINPSRVKNMEEKKSTMKPINSIEIKSSKGADMKLETVAATKLRNPSPTRRFSIGFGRMGRSSSSNENEVITQLSSKHVTGKSGSESAEVSACSDNSIRDRSNSTSKARSSPLRRLLDPLLKTKAANSNQFANPSRKDSTSPNRACKSSDERGESFAVHASVKAKLDLRSCRKVDVDNSHHNGKHRLSTVQALLQVAVKNGLPLFTFAIDNNSDILAATVRKASSSRKGDSGWIYTFFSVREMKKKNGSWLNQGAKDKGHGYIPNVVAQMKVSDPPFSNLSRQNSLDQFSIREFVLFAVDLIRQTDQQSDLQPNDELAAIVVMFPRKRTRSLNQGEQQSDTLDDLSTVGLKESLPDVKDYPNSRGNEETGLGIDNQDLFSTTVILPGGVHGLPSKGHEPSPLIERWKSGGSCDCGGWDMGCRIRVLANQTQLSSSSVSTKANRTGEKFELFSQGEVLDNNPVFSLSPFKDRVFSVEFNSSLTLLQAFSVCIALLSSGKPSEFSELSNSFEDKSSGETMVYENDGIKAPNRIIQEKVPASFASYPPLSPVGRV